MSENTRITRECAMKELNQALSAALYAHIAEYQLGEVESTIQMCCETKSVQQKNGLFGGSEKALQAVALTPHWLLWAEWINGKPATAGSAKLSQINITDYESTAMFNVIPDTGVNVTGRYSNGKQTGQQFIGLDSAPAGKKFRELLREAIKNSTH